MKIAVIGAGGFVGSALMRHAPNAEVVGVTRANYDILAAKTWDFVINASNNSKKYLADQNPAEDYVRAVTNQLRVLRDFPAGKHILISSVDVYADLTSPETTGEDQEIDPESASQYGIHKFQAEEMVRAHCDRFIVLRLAGMVGPGLQKNPIFDILHDRPLWIHPDSEYQFMHTDYVAEYVWQLALSDDENQTFNICGDGFVTPRQVAEMAGKELHLENIQPDTQPRHVRINNEKLARLGQIPTSRSAVERYILDVVF